MGNDDKIEKKSDENSVHKNVLMFLGDELKPLERDAVSSYNLSEEYQKTRANKNRRVWILLAVCFFSVGIAAFLTTLIIYNYDKKIEININTFDDLNLRSLLSNVGRAQSLFEAATKQKASLVASLEAELKQAQQKKENDLFTLESVSSVSSEAALRRREQALEKEYTEIVNRLHEEYDLQIQAAENEIQQYSMQLENYDSSKLADAREQEAVIDSQKQLHDIEMKALTERYEKQIWGLREQMVAQQKAAAEAQRKAVEDVRETYQAKIDLLDPFVNDFHGNQVVRGAGTQAQDGGYDFNAADYKDGILEKDSSYKKLLDSTQQAFDDFDYISSIVSALPQERDIPSYVRAMRAKTYQIGSSLARSNMNLQSQKDFYEGLLDYYLQKNACDGIVTALTDDGKAGNKITVYLSKSAEEKVREGNSSAQIRDGKRVIADVSLERSGANFYARPAEEGQADGLLPFMALYIVLPK